MYCNGIAISYRDSSRDSINDCRGKDRCWGRDSTVGMWGWGWGWHSDANAMPKQLNSSLFSNIHPTNIRIVVQTESFAYVLVCQKPCHRALALMNASSHEITFNANNFYIPNV